MHILLWLCILSFCWKYYVMIIIEQQQQKHLHKRLMKIHSIPPILYYGFI